MDKLEFKKLYKKYYSPKTGKPEIITPPAMQYVMVDGRGDPNESVSFQDAIGALYGAVYTIKFSRKKAGKGTDFSIGALEGLWWTDDEDEVFGIGEKKDWLWTIMIWVPDDVTQDEFKQAVAQLKEKKPNPALSRIRLDTFDEGRVVQIMHIGPYGAEQPSVDKMQAYASAEGYSQAGKHHEIYFGDPRRTAPDKLRTILRHPVKRVQ